METREIPGFPDYRITDTGVLTRVRGGVDPNKPLAFHMGTHGYMRIAIRAGPGVVKHKTRPFLVCSAFHGPRPPGQVVRHLDGCKTNDSANNLAWGTPSQNSHDYYNLTGNPVGNAKLKIEQVREIRARRGTPHAQLASEYGVCEATIHHIFSGRRWLRA